MGLDPSKDITFITPPPADIVGLLEAGKIDAMMGFPPQPQELRAERIGHVVMNATTDRPWSQYFCCMLAASREFARRRPVAAKRALRALLKANDVCASEPDRVAQLYVDRGYADAARSPFIVQAMKELPYGRWPDYDAEDTVRFYALRLREAGLAPSSEVEG